MRQLMFVLKNSGVFGGGANVVSRVEGEFGALFCLSCRVHVQVLAISILQILVIIAFVHFLL